MKYDKLPAALRKRVKFNGKIMTSKDLIDQLIDVEKYHELVVLQRKNSEVYSLRNGKLKVLFVTMAEKAYINDKLKTLNIEIPEAIAEPVITETVEQEAPEVPEPQSIEPNTAESEDYFNDVIKLDLQLSGPNHVLKTGKKIADKRSHKLYLIKKFDHKEILLEHQPYFKNEKRYDISITYQELVERYKANEIDVEGFNHSNQAAFIKAVKDVMVDLKYNDEKAGKQSAEAERNRMQSEKQLFEFLESTSESGQYFQLPDARIFCVVQSKKTFNLVSPEGEKLESDPESLQAIFDQLKNNELPNVTDMVADKRAADKKLQEEKAAHEKRSNNLKSLSAAQQRRIDLLKTYNANR